MTVMALFSTSFFFFAKCLHVGEDGPGLGHLCHTDTFLFFFFFKIHVYASMHFLKVYVNVGFTVLHYIHRLR